MPDLPNRDTFERELTEELSRVLASAERDLANELWSDGMTQAELANAPRSVLQRLERELKRALEVSLAEAYVAAATNFAEEIGFGLDPDAVQEAALSWATEFASEMAADLVRRREQKLDEIAERAPDVELKRRDLLALLALAIGLAGAATIAVTHLSDATSRGEAYTQEELESGGVKVEVLWFTQEDERVCPECAPLHGNAQGNGWRMPPPLHPNCRCYKGYRITSPDGSVQILFDDDEVTELLRA